LNKPLAVLAACVALHATGASATMSFRLAPIDEIQLDSHIRLGYEDAVWVRMNGSWPGVSCGADWGWFNAKDNPQYVATVLTARVTGAPVKIYVDDAKAKLNGSCQIMVITM
jgi:hypothetical protein